LSAYRDDIRYQYEFGYRADGERCVKIACRAGYELDDDGSCAMANQIRALSCGKSTRRANHF
jgi:hypothetical protein